MNEPASNEILDELNTQRDRVDVKSSPVTIRELIRMYTAEELDISPVYQRKFQWPQKTQSEFIESIFLGLPIPPLFMAMNPGFRWEVVDGLQRLNTLLRFCEKSPKDGTKLTLDELERLPNFNGKTFQDLGEDVVRYFLQQTMTVTLLTDKADEDLRYDLFERLNKGSVRLSPQEVRKCMYRGNFMQLLEELSRDSRLNVALKLQKKNQDDGTAEEQVLKFFAYSDDTFRSEFDGKVEHRLNKFTRDQAAASDLNGMRERFNAAIDALLVATNNGPFVRSGYGPTPLVQFEAALVAADRIVRDRKTVKPQDRWIDDLDFQKYSRGGTNSKTMLNARINRAYELLDGDTPAIEDASDDGDA